MKRKLIPVVCAAMLAVFPIGKAEAAGDSTWTIPPTPGCVSWQEYTHIGLNPAISRDELEALWHLSWVDRVNATNSTSGGYNFYNYPACNYSWSQAYVGVTTERTNRPGYDTTKTPGERTVVAIVWWDITGHSYGKQTRKVKR